MSFPHRHPHEAAHLAPLMARLGDLLVAPPREAAVVVQADTRPAVPGAWNVQVFHGLGDKGYTGNPLFLQKGRLPRLRTALNRPLAMLRLPAPFLQPPARPGKRRSRYQQVNAYGPRWADWFADMLHGADVTRFGHVALNEMEGVSSDHEGPVVWMPTWDNRTFLGGPDQSSLRPFASEIARIAEGGVRVIVKYHPLTVRHRQAPLVRKMLEATPNVSVAPPESEPYPLLQGARCLLTDTSSLGFEAYCLGLPVAVLRPPGVRHKGLHKELAERVPVFDASRPGLGKWVLDPEPPTDVRWARELMDAPRRRQNDAFAAQLRQKVVEWTGGGRW